MAGRWKLLLFTCVARTAIASLLLGAGIRWLAQTTSISELMLNCVSLNAILDVDEFLFAGFTPISIQLAVQSLEPLKMTYSRRRSQSETWTLCVLLVATILIPYLTLLVPLSDAMVAVKQELCGGNQTFVLGRNTAAWHSSRVLLWRFSHRTPPRMALRMPKRSSAW